MMMSTTEDSILAEIEAAEQGMETIPYGSEPTDEQAREYSTSTADDQTSQGQEQGESGTETQQQQSGDTTVAADDRSEQKPQQEGSGTDDAGTQPSGVRQDRHGNYVDQKGNIVDQQGNLLASAGSERRVYERAQRVQSENTQLRRELSAQSELIDKLNKASQGGQEFGLSHEETRTGMEVMRQFKADPVAAAQYVISEAMKLGHNLDAIVGKDNAAGASSLDMAAINRLIDSRMQPIMDDRQARQQQSEQEQFQRSVELQYTQFLNDHEFASTHEQEIANVMRDMNVDAPTAYYQIRAWAAENQFDFTKPLVPQINARRQGASPAQAENGAQRQPQSMPIPRGSGSSMQAVPNDQHQGVASMGADDDYDAIVMQAMREANMSA